jgi:hypothetical protein
VNWLDLPLMGAVRRNHALEHATLNVLAEKQRGLRLVGRSDWHGFTLYGTVSSEDVADAVALALERLRAGEKALAIHPRCGTNLATGAVLTGLVASVALGGKRKPWWQKALQLTAGMGAVAALAPSLGVRVQERLTTSAEVGDLQVMEVLRREVGVAVIHRINTRQE